MKILHAFLALLLLTSAVVQLNDPDPWLWVAIYGIAALAPLFALFGRPDRRVPAAGVVACLIGLALSAPGFFDYLGQHAGETLLQAMSADKMYIEETREFLGALIALVIVSIYAFRRRPGGADA